MFNKKGAELSFNIIIVVIILVIVLVLITAFFTGTFTKLSNQIKQKAPDNLVTAVQTCEANCELARTYDSENAQRKSSYCRDTWRFDTDNDGLLDKEGEDLKEYHCSGFPIDALCPGVECAE